MNLLRVSRVNPRLSAYAYIFGQYDFNANPLAPPGSKIIIHKKVDDKDSWSYHGKVGWFVAPVLNHYRCVTCYVPSTHSEVIADTVHFLPEHIPFPK